MIQTQIMTQFMHCNPPEFGAKYSDATSEIENRIPRVQVPLPGIVEYRAGFSGLAAGRKCLLYRKGSRTKCHPAGSSNKCHTASGVGAGATTNVGCAIVLHC